MTLAFYGCSQDLGPGNNFELFKNTANWPLAQTIIERDYKKLETILNKENSVKINLQEPVYNQTLLNISIGNYNITAVKILLNHGANINIPDTFGFPALHKAVMELNSKKNSVEIIKLLIEHGANPNSVALINNHKSKYLPLMGAIVNLDATKILLDHGADLYYRDSLDYPIWSIMLGGDLYNSENIYVAKYVIVDKQMSIPNPVFYTTPSGIPRDIHYLLEKFDTHGDIKKQKTKSEILNYLKIKKI